MQQSYDFEDIYGNHKFSYETLKQAYINVVDVALANIEKGKKCCVVKDLRNDDGEPLDGQKTSFGVLINEDGLKDLYERGDCTVIETAFHETFHIYQKKRLDDLIGESHVEKIAQICGGDFLTIIAQLKEKVLEKCDDNYYKKNYAFHTIETEANIQAKAMVIKYLDSLPAYQLLRRGVIEHIGTSGRSIYRKETKSGRRNIV